MTCVWEVNYSFYCFITNVATFYAGKGFQPTASLTDGLCLRSLFLYVGWVLCNIVASTN